MGKALGISSQLKPALSVRLAFQLKPISKALILAESLDLLTTLVGIALFPQLMETNPLPGLLGGFFPVLLVKFLATIGIVVVLERVKKWPGLVWIVPTIAFLPVFWNLLNILAEALV